jgi:hypothetical protein
VLALPDELLEAQPDTIELLGESPRTPRRHAHAGYLQVLHRLGRCVGAQVAVGDRSPGVAGPAVEPGLACSS